MPCVNLSDYFYFIFFQKRRRQSKKNKLDVYSSEAEADSEKDSAKENTTDAKSEQSKKKETSLKRTSPKCLPDKGVVDSSSSSESNPHSDSDQEPEVKKNQSNRPPLQREDAITSDSEEDSAEKPKVKKPQKKKKHVAFDTSSSDSDILEKRPPPQKVEKSPSNEKKTKKKPNTETNEKQRKLSKDKDDKKMKIKGRPHITFTEDDSDTDEYPINKKNENSKKKSKKISVLESDSSDSEVSSVMNMTNKQDKMNTSVTLSSDDESEPVRTLTKAEKKAKVFVPKTEENVPNKKKEKTKDKKLKKEDSKDEIRKKKKDRDGMCTDKVHKKVRENDVSAVKAEKRENVAKVFGFSDTDSNLSPFAKEKPVGKKIDLDNLFEFEQDGSSSDLPELVVETTSSKTSFLEKLEAELTDEKPQTKKELPESKPDINGEREDRDKIKKKKKKKLLEVVEPVGKKEEQKTETGMPALAKVNKSESAAVEANKGRSGDNIFEKMDGMKEEQMPVLESENISSDDVEKLDDYGDPPSDLQIETQESVGKEEDDKKEVEKSPVLTEEQRREQLEKAVAGIISVDEVNAREPPKPEPIVSTPIVLQEPPQSREPSAEREVEKQEEPVEESKELRVEEDLEAAARLAAMLEGSFDADAGIAVDEPEPEVPVVVEEQQEEVITDNTPPGMQDETSLALQALKASTSSESEDNETTAQEETRLPEPWASMQTIHKAVDRDDSSKTESEAEVQQETPTKKRGRVARRGRKKMGNSDTDLSDTGKDAGLSSADETPKTQKVEESPTPLVKPSPLFIEPRLFEDEDDDGDRLFISETSDQPEETSVSADTCEVKPVDDNKAADPGVKAGFFRSTFVEIQGPPEGQEEGLKRTPDKPVLTTAVSQKMAEPAKHARDDGQEVDVRKGSKPDASMFGFSLDEDDIDDDDDDEGKLEIAEDIPESSEQQSQDSPIPVTKPPARGRGRGRGRGHNRVTSPGTAPVAAPAVVPDDEPVEPPTREMSSNQRSPTRASTRAKLAEEQAQLTSDQRYSSRGRKIIPKERDDELLYGRKGRKPATTPEPVEPVGRGRSRRGASALQPDSEVSPRTPFKRTRRGSLRGYQDEEDSKASEDADTKDDDTSETEAVRLTPRTRRSTRRSGRIDTEAEKEDEKEKEEDKTDDSELPDIESPKPRRGRRPKARKSTEGPGQSPRKSSESVPPNSPRARLESGSTSPKATPVVKLEKIDVDQTLKRTEGKEEDGSGVQSPPTTRFGKFITRSVTAEKVHAGHQYSRSQEKDVFEWEDDDEKPVPKLVHKQTRRRRGTSDASGTEGGASPSRAHNCDEISVDTLDIKKSSKPVAAPEEPTPKIAGIPKEAEPPVQKMPDPSPQEDVTSPTDLNLPPKLELKRDKELGQLQVELDTLVSSPRHIPAAVTQTSITVLHTAISGDEHVSDKIPKEWKDNMDKIIDEVAKGNFNRDEDNDFCDKKKVAGRASKNRGEIEQLSPRARALLGLTEPGVSPSPISVCPKGQVLQPPQTTQQQYIPPGQQQFPQNQQRHLPPRPSQLGPPVQTSVTVHQQQTSHGKPQVASTLQHATPTSVIQQTPHSQGK